MNSLVDEFPLTLTQQDIYFDQLHYGDSPLYNVGGYIRLARCDIGRLQRAHADLVAGTDVFGIRIRSTSAGVRQEISTERTTALPLIDLSEEEDPDAVAKDQLESLFKEPFLLEGSELYRAFVIRLSESRYWYVCIAHHLIMDGWGFANLARVLGEHYHAQVSGSMSAWREVVASDQRYLESARYRRDREYWLTRCTVQPEKLLKPFYEERFKEVVSVPSGRETIQIDASDYRRVQDLASTLGVGVPQLLLACLVAYFSRAYERRHLVVGVPAHNRSGHAEKKMLGAFTSVSPLFVEAQEGLSFGQLARAIRETQQKDFRHQRYPIGHLVRDLGMTGHDSSLYDLGFNYLKLNSFLSVGGEQSELVYLSHQHEATPFILTVWEYGEDLPVELQFDYNQAYFEQSEARRVAERYLHLLKTVAAAGQRDLPLDTLPVLTSAEDLEARSGPTAFRSEPVNNPVSVQEAFQRLVEQAPDRQALISEGRALSYAELNSRSNQLARHLRDLGVGEGFLVAVCLRRSPELLVSVMAVLKVGGAYLPLDPDYPAARLDFMLSDSGAGIVITEASVDFLPRREGMQRVHMDDTSLASGLANLPFENLDRSEGFSDRSPAYVMYTSGSTGQPKGVLVTHANLISYFSAVNAHYEIGERDVVLQFSSCSFDIFVEEVFISLLSGGTLVLRTDEIMDGGDAFWRFVNTHQVSVLCLATAYWHTLCSSLKENSPPVSCLRLVSVGGEAMSGAMLRRWRGCFGDAVKVLNTYGPTECTVVATVFDTADVQTHRSAVPIGEPIGSTRCYVLDGNQRLLPAGVPGELYLAGGGVAIGYLNRPDLTDQKFLPDPFGAPGQRMYRTGDLVRRLGSGVLDFLGRVDGQMKIRGFRVEPGEIEAAFLECDFVKEAVVRKHGEPAELAAYVVFDHGRKDLVALKSHLRKRLPDYMLPAAVVGVEAIPRTLNGKIDGDRLPRPIREDYIANAYIAPSYELEAALSQIWAEVLKLERVGIDDHFFDVGGNSLLAVELQQVINKRLGVDLRVTDLFAYPTIETLAASLTGADRDATNLEADKRAVRENPVREDLAIIAMSCRFPDAETPEMFWENIREGKESIQFFTDQQLSESGVQPELLAQPNYVKSGFVLHGLEEFDAEFFGFTPREAELLDPQQRILLECAQEALERAGHGQRAKRNKIGVFVGVGQNRYLFENILPNRDLMDVVGETAVMIANLGDFASTRISHRLDLRGPSINVHTACSSSLVAVHMACASLIDGSSDIALAGGSSISMFRPTGVLADQGGIASPDGHCRAFDADADGTRPGSGAGIVVIRRLNDALASGDPILAVVKGSSINNDGANKVGYTAPSVEGQAEVIRDALSVGGVQSSSVSYVEAHGTGTKLGDPIEIEALRRVFPALGTQYCAIGSVKPNIGHLDSAAGIAGLMKVVMSIGHGVMPPQINFRSANPEIDLDSSPFFVNRDASEWSHHSGVRTAGVSSFGIGGTNAHVVLQEPPFREEQDSHREEHLIVLSGRTESALKRSRKLLADYLVSNPSLSLADIGYTLQLGRRSYDHRFFTVASSLDELTRALGGFDQSGTAASRDGAPEVVFLFPGQGSQYPGMGHDIYRHEPVFKSTFDRCAELLLPDLVFDIRDALFPTDELETARLIDETRITQPLLFSFEYSLFVQLRAWGIEPSLMIGHSLGEYVAACAAGVFELSDALRLVAARGRLMQKAERGAMLSVPLSEADLREFLVGSGAELAAVNAHDRCVAAGTPKQISSLEDALDAVGIAAFRLNTSHAFHTSLMDPVLEEFLAVVDSISLNAPRRAYVSNVTGELATSEQVRDPNYWVRHLRSTVRFSDGAKHAIAGRNRIFVEIGPGSTLGSLVRHDDRDARLIKTVGGSRDPGTGESCLLSALGGLWAAGVEVNHREFFRDDKRRKVTLPPHPFERRRYWLDSPVSQSLKSDPPRAELYQPAWMRQELVPDEAYGQVDWLVVENGDGYGGVIAQGLAERGHRVAVVVKQNDGSSPPSAQGVLWIVDSDDHSNLRSFLRDRPTNGRRVVIPGPIDTGASVSTRSKERAQDCVDRFLSVLDVVRAVVSSDTDARFSLVTRSAQSVTGTEAICTETSVLSGICRVVPQEFPGMSFRQIDLDDGFARRDQLLEELESPQVDIEVAYRGMHRWVKSFVPLRTEEPSRALGLLRERGVYVITGGLGNIGLALAEFLGRQYRARIALIGRSDFPERSTWQARLDADDLAQRTRHAIEVLVDLERNGIEVLVLSANVANESDMQSAFEDIERRLGAIHGVIHCAGAMDDSIVAIQDTDREHVEKQFSPKVSGLRVLDAVLGSRSPDFCLLMSSLSSVLGGLGFAAYAGANAFMDAFVQGKRNVGDKRWLSINWEGWNFGRDDHEAGMYRFAISPQEGVRIFSRVLQKGNPAQTINSNGFLDDRRRQRGFGGQDPVAQSALLQDDRSRIPTDYVAPRFRTEADLVEIWQKLLGIRMIGVDDDFFVLGGDSLMLTRMLGEVNRRWKINIPIKTAFERPTVTGLAVCVAGLLSGDDQEDTDDAFVEELV